MKLSDRLNAVASFVKTGSNVADIGTDHGYIPIFLVEEQIADAVIAMDVRKGPLERARSHIKTHGLQEKIQVRLSDGLASLKPGEADTVVIAGMGGDLIIRILSDGRHVWSCVEHWILSPQSEPDKVRMFLEEHGFLIQEEMMVLEEGKYYTVMLVEKGEMKYGRYPYYRYGKYLIQNRDPVLQEYLKREKKQVQEIYRQVSENNTENAEVRCRELQQELDWIQEAEDEMQSDH